MSTSKGSGREVGNARSSSDASVVKPGIVIEAGKARGMFTASCVGPIERDRARYEEKRQQLFDLLGEEIAQNMLRRSSPGYYAPGFVDASLAPEYRRHRKLVIELLGIEFEEKFSDVFPNVITTVGANEMLDKYFAGSAYTAACVMGLKAAGAAVIADTMASHASWLEVGLANAPVYTGNRPVPTWSAAAAKVKALAAAINYAFTSGGTVAGAFLVQGGSATKDNTTGVLVSAGDFTGGNKTVANTDQINVSWSASV
jgi:hypothetical protein